MMESRGKGKLVEGVLHVVVGECEVEVPYCEHENRNGQLFADMSGVNSLDLMALRSLADQLEAEETLLRQGRKRYARLAVEAAIWEEEVS